MLQHPQFQVPKFDGRYIEPFLGSASMFFALRPRSAILSDVNQELITVYQALREQPDLVYRYLRVHAQKHSKAYYYDVRDHVTPTSIPAKAARFLYLNRTCWNGLYRVNLKGEFNVPKGTKSSVLLDTDDFIGVSEALKSATLLCSDFAPVIEMAGKGDLVYADPPYTVHHNLNGFIKYNEVLFSWQDQERLKRSLLKARDRGATVILSNANHPSVQKLYAGVGRATVLDRRSVISGKSSGRRVTSELLIRL